MPGVRFPGMKRALMRIACISMLAPGLSGCLAAAAQLAPVALQASARVISVATSSALASGDPAPGVIELREDASGATEYREMHITSTANDARWTPVTSYQTNSDGWQPAEHLMQMDFAPPLKPQLSGARIVYLAYAPLYDHLSYDDQVRLNEFDRSFGAPVGTFKWKGRTYQYSLPDVLPPLEID
ncbi:MAG TPA: hypothetical protein VMT64_09465 [Candidatus Binataceae bacterium]|nr:hypothetical protein [Candidatus Binataceae bacterium]